jgi:endogenous inhibitor of DNA gyrase (YacG/DUF329 family)
MTPCEFCGQSVRQSEHRKRKRFCSDKCRMSWWNRRYAAQHCERRGAI